MDNSWLISGNHHGSVERLIISSPHVPVVFSQSWLRRHNPHIDWSTGAVVSWSTFCHSHCHQSASAPINVTATTPIEPPNLMLVPPIYHDLGGIQHSASPNPVPHRPYDCAINLLPGAPLPSSRLFKISALKERPWRNTYTTPWQLGGGRFPFCGQGPPPSALHRLPWS